MTKKDMHDYGYLWDEMIPLEAPMARKLFKAGGFIYKLYVDGSEGHVTELREIDKHTSLGGMVGTYSPCLECSMEDSCCTDDTDIRHMCGTNCNYAEIMYEYDKTCESYRWVKELAGKNEKATA